MIKSNPTQENGLRNAEENIRFIPLFKGFSDLKARHS
jgi:hypothetical protein